MSNDLIFNFRKLIFVLHQEDAKILWVPLSALAQRVSNYLLSLTCAKILTNVSSTPVSARTVYVPTLSAGRSAHAPRDTSWVPVTWSVLICGRNSVTTRYLEDSVASQEAWVSRPRSVVAVKVWRGGDTVRNVREMDQVRSNFGISSVSSYM